MATLNNVFSGRTFVNPDPYPRPTTSNLRLSRRRVRFQPLQPSNFTIVVDTPYDSIEYIDALSVNEDRFTIEAAFMNTPITFAPLYEPEDPTPLPRYQPRVRGNPAFPYGRDLPPPYQRHDPMNGFGRLAQLAADSGYQTQCRCSLRAVSTSSSSRSQPPPLCLYSRRCPFLLPPRSVIQHRPVAPQSITFNCSISHRTFHLPRTRLSDQRPFFAVYTPRIPFISVSSLVPPAKSFLVNTPFVGEYYPSSLSTPARNMPINSRSAVHCVCHSIAPIAIAVYARYDFMSDRIWLAVRRMWMTPSAEGRRYSMEWMLYSEFMRREAHDAWSDRSIRRQVFVPRREFAWDGQLNEALLITRWNELNIQRSAGFELGDFITRNDECELVRSLQHDGWL